MKRHRGLYSTADRLSVLVILSLLVSDDVLGQTVREIAGVPGKLADELRLSKLASIPDSSDGSSRNPGVPLIRRDRRGNYYTFHSFEATIFMYDSTGRFVKRIGRRGGGPGEYEGFLDVYPTAGDTLRIFSRARLTVLAPTTHKVVRTAPMTAGALFPEMATMVGNVAVWNGRSRTRTAITQKDGGRKASEPGGMQAGTDDLVVFDSSGRLVRTFGSRLPPGYVYRRDDQDYSWQRGALCSSGTNGVWSTLSGFRLERWSLQGKLLAQISRSKDPESAWRRDDPKAIGVARCHESADGLLWILALAPTDSTEQREAGLVEPGHARVSTVPVFDHIVEILDPARGTVVASQRFGPIRVIGFFPGNLVYSWRETESGEQFLDIWRVERKSRPR